jgi:hypothetical protein
MKRLLLLIGITSVFSWGCTAPMTAVQLEKKYGPNAPVIVKVGAAKQITGGQPWRVYLAAEDPDGDMARIKFEIRQPGRGILPSHWKILDSETSQSFSGYFYLNTPAMTPRTGREFLYVTLTLTIKVFDEAQHGSEEISIPFEITTGDADQPVPPGFSDEENRSLGPIMIDLWSEKTLWSPSRR